MQCSHIPLTPSSSPVGSIQLRNGPALVLRGCLKLRVHRRGLWVPHVLCISTNTASVSRTVLWRMTLPKDALGSASSFLPSPPLPFLTTALSPDAAALPFPRDSALGLTRHVACPDWLPSLSSKRLMFLLSLWHGSPSLCSTSSATLSRWTSVHLLSEGHHGLLLFGSYE